MTLEGIKRTFYLFWFKREDTEVLGAKEWRDLTNNLKGSLLLISSDLDY